MPLSFLTSVYVSSILSFDFSVNFVSWIAAILISSFCSHTISSVILFLIPLQLNWRIFNSLLAGLCGGLVVVGEGEGGGDGVGGGGEGGGAWGGVAGGGGWAWLVQDGHV